MPLPRADGSSGIVRVRDRGAGSQDFFAVTAKNGANRWRACREPQRGHAGFLLPCSVIAIAILNIRRHFPHTYS